MKVIFLDVDGVLNDHRTLLAQKTQKAIKEEAVDLLKKIIDATGAEIVLSSTWRRYPDFLEYVSGKLEERGLKIIGQTPKLYPEKLSAESIPRREEIQSWLNDHPEVEKFAIIDDDIDASIAESYFQTYFYEYHDGHETALTEEIANLVIMHLTGE